MAMTKQEIIEDYITKNPTATPEMAELYATTRLRYENVDAGAGTVTVDAAGNAVTKTSAEIAAEASKNAVKYDSKGNLLTVPGNSVMGDYGMKDGGFWMGGTQNGITTSGVLQPAFKLGMGAWNAYQAYQSLEENEKQNAAKISLANEGIYMKRTDQHNKIAKQRRNQQMGLGNANNTGYMSQIAAANPYKTYRDYTVPYQ